MKSDVPLALGWAEGRRAATSRAQPDGHPRLYAGGDSPDHFCAECGSAFGEPAPVSIARPSATPYALASYSTRNQERIRDACPHASEVRTFHGWLAAGRVVCKGQKGIRIVAPDTLDGDKITSIKHLHVFDVTQTQERTQRAAA